MAGSYYLIVEFYNGDLFHAERKAFRMRAEQTVKDIAGGHHEHVCRLSRSAPAGRDRAGTRRRAESMGCVGNTLLLKPWQAAIVKQCIRAQSQL